MYFFVTHMLRIPGRLIFANVALNIGNADIMFQVSFRVKLFRISGYEKLPTNCGPIYECYISFAFAFNAKEHMLLTYFCSFKTFDGTIHQNFPFSKSWRLSLKCQAYIFYVTNVHSVHVVAANTFA